MRWITLDAACEDPARSWAYVASAVDLLGRPRTRCSRVSLSRGAGVELAVDALPNGFVEYGRSFAEVLDDLHLLCSEASFRSIEHELSCCVTNAYALLVLAAIGAARSRLRRAASDFERAQAAISELPDPGRSPAPAYGEGGDDARARVRVRERRPIEEPRQGELAVPRYLASDFSQREIGARLYLSLNMVKTHTRELYRKPGASSRSEAVMRATRGLLDWRESPG